MSRGMCIIQIWIFVVVCFAAKIEASVVGCFHCSIESQCSVVNRGISFHPVKCYTDHCAGDVTCYGIQFDVNLLVCYTFQRNGTTCDNLVYTSSSIFVYRMASRTDCSLLTLTEYHGYSYNAVYIQYEVDPSSYGNCVRECFDRSSCSDVVYKSDWGDCYVYDDCSSGCGAYTYYGTAYSLYRFVCTADCGLPDSISDGIVGYSLTIEGYTATYSCNAGYSLDGDETSVCEDNGSWSNSPPTCQPADCGHPDFIASGVTSYSATTYGSMATYTCNDGYSLIGSEKTECDSDGQWTNSAPSCQPINCGPPDVIIYGIVAYSSTTVGSTAKYRCTEGYTLKGNDTRICLNDTNWSGSAPECETVDCDSPDSIANGDFTYVTGTIASTHGTEVVYTCDPSYVLNGVAKRTCNSTGSWTGTLPSCVFAASTSSTLATTEATSTSQLTTASSTTKTISSSAPATGSSISSLPTSVSTLSGSFSTVWTSNSSAVTTAMPTSSLSTATVFTTQPPVVFTSTIYAAFTIIQPTSSFTTTTSSVPPVSTPSPAPSTTSTTQPIYLWPCLCSSNSFSGKSQEEVIAELVKDVKIDASSTLLSARKLQCMQDVRESASTVGALGIAVLCAVGCFLLAFDLLRCFTCPCCR